MDEVVARGNGNVPLIQSWGMRESALNLPYTGSLSLTLDRLEATVRWRHCPAVRRDEIVIDGMPAAGATAGRLQSFIDLLRDGAARAGACAVTITTAAAGARGIGMTTAVFAALALAGSVALDRPRTPRLLSMLARRGTGSAARSMFGGWVEGVGGELGDGSDCYAEPLADADHWPLAALIAVVDAPAASRGGAHDLKRSPFFPAWLQAHEDDLDAARAAIRARDLERLGAVIEPHALRARAVALATVPPIISWAPATVSVIACVHALRAAGRAAYFTVGAAPHVTVLCAPGDAAAVAASLVDIPGVTRVIRSGPGDGARLVTA